MNSIVLASGNTKKLREMTEILTPLGLKVVPQSDFAVAEAAETGLSFVENAILKARNAARHTGLAAIADDSGIEVDALNGAPGIYSARFAGSGANDADNNALLIEKLRDIPEAQRSCRYQCLIVFMRHADDPVPIICQGSWEGRITLEPRGNQGFGYDPHFLLADRDITAAELSSEEKHQLSHRGRALALLAQALRDQQNHL